MSIDAISRGLAAGAASPINLSKNGIPRITQPLKVAVIGESIGRGGNDGTYPRTDWVPTNGTVNQGRWSPITPTNLTIAFVVYAWPDHNCASGDTYSLAWDGAANLTVNIAGGGVGAAVNVTGGGFFHLMSGGGNGKGMVVMLRTAQAPATAKTDTGTVSGNLSMWHLALDGLWNPALASLGLANLDLRNFCIPSELPSDTLARIGQVIAESPDVALVCVGTNSITQTAQVHAVLNALVAAVPIVVVIPMFPRGDLSTTASVQSMVNMMIDTYHYAKSIKCAVFDGWSLFVNNSGTTGNGVIQTPLINSDYIHMTPMGTTFLKGFLGPFLNKIIQNLTGTFASLANAYSANNPYGNLLAAAGAMIGTTGTLGSNPTPTGTLTQNWTDAAQVGAFTSVVYSRPARTDGPYSGSFQRVVAANTSGANASRTLTAYATVGAGAITAGMLVRARLTARFSATTLLNNFEPSVYLIATNNQSHYLTNCGYAQQAGGTIADSGTLYFCTRAFAIPAGITGVAFTISYGCATGGGITLDLQDAIIEPIPQY